MKRDWMDSPKFTIHTSFGFAECSITSATHVYVDANSNGKALEYRGKRYAMSFHLAPVQGRTGWEPQQGTSYAVYGEVPPSFKAKLTEAVCVAVSAHLARHPDLIKQAAIVSANNDVFRADRDIAELEEQLEPLKAKRAALEAELEKLGG